MQSKSRFPNLTCLYPLKSTAEQGTVGRRDAVDALLDELHDDDALAAAGRQHVLARYYGTAEELTVKVKEAFAYVAVLAAAAEEEAADEDAADEDARRVTSQHHKYE